MDANSLTLTYSLEGRPDKDSFNIEGSTGQIKTKEPLNTEFRRESNPPYSVFVVVEDGDGGSDVIMRDDQRHGRQRAAVPTCRADGGEGGGRSRHQSDDESTMMLKVSWVAPETTGPAITNYNVEYREGTSGAFLEDNCRETTGANNCRGIEGTETVITDLMPNSSYQVRVTAISDDEQDSLPSPTRTGSTMPSNNPPVFSQATIERTVDENTPAGRNIGRPITATDSDSGDTLTYSLETPTPTLTTIPRICSTSTRGPDS